MADPVLFCGLAAVDLSCQEGEMAVFAHLPAFAGEASWTITDANGDEVCAAEYPGTACHWYYGCEGGVDHHESGCCLPIDSGPASIAIFCPAGFGSPMRAVTSPARFAVLSCGGPSLTMAAARLAAACACMWRDG